MYYLLCKLFNSPEGWNIVTYTTYVNSDEGEVVTANVSMYMTNGFIFNLFGLAIGILGSLVLRAQGAFSNVVEKLLEDKRLEEEIRKNDEEFSIPDLDEDEEKNDSEFESNKSDNQ